MPSQESGRSCICVLRVSILYLSTILELFRQCRIFFSFFFHFYGMYTSQQMAENKYIIIMIIRYFLNAVNKYNIDTLSTQIHDRPLS
jgi:hypothetical protein